MMEDSMLLRDCFSILRRFLVLTCLTMLCLALATFASGLADISVLTGPVSDSASPGAADAFLPTLLFSFLLAGVFGAAIMRSRWRGYKLITAVFVSLFGLMTIMTHSESIVFLRHTIRGGLIVTLFVMGAIFAGLFAPTAVAVMGKLRAVRGPGFEPKPTEVSFAESTWRILAIGALYLLIYNLFGYFIAWKSPAVQDFYGGIDEGTFLRHLSSLWRSSAWVFPFQFTRGILWALFALPIVRMYRGNRWEAALIIALLFSVWSTQLLAPNPFMPEAVARVHFAETSTSNFLFGWLVGLLLTGRGIVPPKEISAPVGNEGARRVAA
jgi:hypothetical protein